MKLRHQIFLLLIFPLVCQLATVGSLMGSLSAIDQVAKKEATAKRVVAICQESIGLFGSIAFEIAAPSFFIAGNDSNHARDLVSTSLSKISELQSLVKGNEKATRLCDSLKRDATRFIEELDELVHSYSSSDNEMFFAQYTANFEFFESLKVLWSQLYADLQEIINIYAPVAQEFRPESVRSRENLRNAVIALVISNVLVVLGLAIAVNKHTLNRLQVLLRNMRTFSRGQQGYEKLKGTDEIAELDAAFKEMADERNKLDEIRKSLQAMLSHDIRSPLSSLDLTVEFILSTYNERLEPDVQKRLGRMHSELKRLSRLVQTLLDVEKLESGHLEVSPTKQKCGTLIGSALTAVSSLADRKKIQLITQTDDEMVLFCDGDRTIQVLVNFISNAIKFAPVKSSITIRTTHKGEGRVLFEVIDEGPGVPADKVGKLFAKFGQLDQPSDIKKQGTGLGLFICKMLIEAQKGQVGYSSPGDKGACFWFELTDQPDYGERLLEEEPELELDSVDPDAQ